jgi:hypothetical protein
MAALLPNSALSSSICITVSFVYIDLGAIEEIVVPKEKEETYELC